MCILSASSSFVCNRLWDRIWGSFFSTFQEVLSWFKTPKSCVWWSIDDIPQSNLKNNLQECGDETHLSILGWQGLAKWKSAVSWDSSQSQKTGRGNLEISFLGSFRQRYTNPVAFFLLTLKGELGTDRDIHADISTSEINAAYIFPQKCTPQYWTNFSLSFD